MEQKTSHKSSNLALLACKALKVTESLRAVPQRAKSTCDADALSRGKERDRQTDREREKER